MLTEQDKEVRLKEIPSEATLSMYTFNGFYAKRFYDKFEVYQNLLGARFVNKSGFPIEGQKKRNIKVKKEWNTIDGKKTPGAEKVTIRLKVNGNASIDHRPIELSAPNWEGTFENLSIFDKEGVPYNYTIEEDYVKGFEAKVKVQSENEFIVYNTEVYEQPKVDISARKVWKENNGDLIENAKEIGLKATFYVVKAKNQDEASKIPSSQAIRKVVLDGIIDEIETSPWVAQFKGLEPLKGEDYFVNEEKVDGFKTEIVQKQSDGFEITNTREKVETIGIDIVKLWQAQNGDAKLTGTPTEVTFKLTANGKDAIDIQNNNVSNVKVVVSNGFYKATIANLPKVDGTGTAIEYKIEEQPITGYTEQTQNSIKSTNNPEAAPKTAGGNYTLVVYNKENQPDTPKPVETVGINVQKLWRNLKGDITTTGTPASVTFTLKADGQPAKDINGLDVSVVKLEPKNYEKNILNLPKFKASKTLINYTIEETTVDGYYETSESIKSSIGQNPDPNPERPGINYDLYITNQEKGPQTTTVKFSKQDIAGNELANADITLTSDKGDKQQWKSDGKVHEFKVKEGKYTFEETLAPNGYKIATKITFDVVRNADTKALEIKNIVIGDGNKKLDDGTLVMVDAYAMNETTVKFSKQDIAGKELANADITLTSDKGDKQQWKSDGKVHEFKVTEGKYTFEEVAAPNGYKVATKITFEVVRNADTRALEMQNVVIGDGNKKLDDGTLVMVDAYVNHKVVVSKTDVSGKELPGAKLNVKSEDGKVDLTWTSTEVSKELELTPGTYTLTETTAPNGYVVAESITFTVDINGKVTVKGTDMNGKVTMVDGYSTHEVLFSKVDDADLKPLKDAKLRVALENGDVIDEWMSEEVAHKIDLLPGKYIMTEVSAPMGYEIASPITFVVAIDGRIFVIDSNENIMDQDITTIVMKDKKIEVPVIPIEPSKPHDIIKTEKPKVIIPNTGKITNTTPKKPSVIIPNTGKVTTPKEEKIKKVLPNTGDSSSNISIALGLLILALAGIVIKRELGSKR